MRLKKRNTHLPTRLIYNVEIKLYIILKIVHDHLKVHPIRAIELKDLCYNC
jgi:hypothetical protein